MKSILITFCLIILTAIAAQAQTYSHVQYQESDENFPNPERGFYHAMSNLDYNTLRSFREEGITLIYWDFKLDDFKDKEIAPWYLRKMEADFATMRRAGVKAVIRFSYTEKSTPPYGDAPINIVLMHIRQVKPVLMANSDVILVVQAGFIGAWGEWYYTDYYATSPGHINEEQWGWRRAIVDSLLGAVSENRMVQLRTPNYKKHVLQMDEYIPVNEEEAFNGSAISRIGHHNDCFVASNSDYGTYQDTTVEKPYLAEDTKFTMIGGETCNVCSYSHCENTLKELKRFHWTFLNIDYHTGVIGDWIEEGCFPVIQTKLGYRYRLISADMQDATKPLGGFNFSLKIINDGWSNPLNPRNIEVVLRNVETQEEYYLPLDSDPRLWPLNDTINLTINSGIPDLMEGGNYEVFLFMPDPEGNLTLRTDYTLQMANTGTWDSVSGYNSLLHAVNINEDNVGEAYAGRDFFRKKNQVIQNNIQIIIDGYSEDWEAVPLLYTDPLQNAEVLKVTNTADSLFFLVEGDGLQPDYLLFIDADNNTETGYHAQQWIANGSDYLIQEQALYKYTGDGASWSWEEIGPVELAQNSQVLEFKAGINEFTGIELSNGFMLAYVNDPENLDNASYLPAENESFVTYNQNYLFGAPPALHSTHYGNNVVLYWVRNDHKNIRTILERSENGIDFVPILSAENATITYVDKDLEVGSEYSYRIRYADGYNYSEHGETITQTIDHEQRLFARIRLDGNPEDWSMVPPVATGMTDEEMAAVRFFDNPDTLFVSIETGNETNINDYQLFLDTAEENGFEYKISNDTLYMAVESGWGFKKILSCFQNANFLEFAVPQSDIDWEDKDSFRASAFVNGQNIWGESDLFYYLKYGIIEMPQRFKIKASVSDPYHKIKVQWEASSNVEGFIVERSVGDSLHFEPIADLSYSKNYYLDGGLDSAEIYYYRMYSYVGVSVSSYTDVMWMKPGWTGIGENTVSLLENVLIMPNPARDKVLIRLQTKQKTEVKVTLYDVNHREVADIFLGEILKDKDIRFGTGGLSRGIYLIGIDTQGVKTYKKLILY